ncbi:MAG: hypothetical protein IH931_01060, partial [candidate division Zixibacteria bacterium]|nr:hypothetical protein [candidate division Zixibacteria bacterium]
MADFYNCVPVREKDGVLVLAMADPLNISHLDDLRRRDVGGSQKSRKDCMGAGEVRGFGLSGRQCSPEGFLAVMGEAEKGVIV